MNRYHFILSLFLFIIINCSTKNKDSQLTGIEVTNGIVLGTITYNGNPVEDVFVTLYPIDYNPVTDDPNSLQKVTTNSKGEYQFIVSTEETFNLSAKQPNEDIAVLIPDIEVNNQSNLLINGKLEPTSTLVIGLDSLSPSVDDYFYIPGTEHYVIVRSADISARFVTLNSVPPGEYHKLQYEMRNLLENNPIIIPSDTLVFSNIDTIITFLDLPISYSYKISINTSSTGCGTTSSVYDFPLLVRLDSTVMDSIPMGPRGPHFHFTNSDGTKMFPFQIERWDSSSRLAEIWVLIDSIIGNNNSQFINLNAGGKTALIFSSGPSVFDTTNGYEAVWHLAESPNTNVNGYKDATTFGHHGTGINMNSTYNGDGIIGSAQRFDGDSNYIEIPNDPAFRFGDGDFTSSAFVNADNFDLTNQIFYKRYLGQNFEFQITNNGELQIIAKDSLALTQERMFSISQLNPNTWYHISITSISGIVSLYINGVFDSQLDVGIQSVSADIKAVIGAQPWANNKEYFQGFIDELRISRVARSRDWIKLNYENQKLDADMITISLN